ncbi:MAG TPA: tricarballylate utilization 4Fe-4S protein TcuB [Rhodoblastus sp.]|nr:tricarballylate utilization 4Fe-4S protein TcuB [Rhodoblastus sp.]
MPPLAESTAASTPAEREIARVMQICNACRYCEGFCAVFPAMTRRLEFGKADVHYLANLCHNCGACLHACQYAPPHEFMVNVPQAMAKARVETYREFAWPRMFGRLYAHAGLTVGLSLAAGCALFLLLAAWLSGGLVRAVPGGDFYAVFPHNLLVLLFGAAFLFALVALGVGALRFWRDVSPANDPRDAPLIAKARAPAALEAAGDVATLKYLGGGHGQGCNEEDDRFTLARRRFHHLTFYGFLLCFASTSVATIYHYFLGLHAPYGWTSAPVALGALGGAGLIVGPAGLMWLNFRRDPLHGDGGQRTLDRGFIGLLFLVSATGFAVLLLRETAALPVALALHLGAVIAFFVTAPYSKFAHAAFRCAALLKFTIEKRLPNRLSLGSD